MVNKKRSHRVTPRQSASMNILHKENRNSIRQIHQKFPQYSLSTVYRHATKDERENRTRKKKIGRPRIVTDRDERKLVLVLKELRKTDGFLNSKKLQLQAGLTHLSNRTVRAILNKHGYKYLQSRRKGLLSGNDLKRRLRFARGMIKNYPEDVWTKQICFYLDASSFVHKTNPADQARAPATRVWRKRNEVLKQGCTSKGKKVDSGGKVAHFMVSISYGKGVYFCEQFEKMNGPYFSDFVKRRFRKLFRGSCNPSGKMFVQDGDPSQNSAAARKEMKKLGVEVHSIPPRSPDINPIENVFHLLDRKLRSEAVEQNITNESYKEFSARVKSTIENIPVEQIDKIIDTMPKRMRDIISVRGERIKY